MVYSVQQIKYEIIAYIKEFGGDFADYYVGVTAEPEAALFQRHKIDKRKDPYLWKQALTFHAARNVQRYFLERLGTDGEAAVRGDETVDCVYVYKKSERTKP
jgi:hypothetical protein